MLFDKEHKSLFTQSPSLREKRGSKPCGHKLDSRRVVYLRIVDSWNDPTGHRPVGSLRPTFVGMTKPEDWFSHSLSAILHVSSEGGESRLLKIVIVILQHGANEERDRRQRCYSF